MAFSGGSIRTQYLSAAGQVFLQRVDFRREQVNSGPRNYDDGGIGRNSRLLRERQGLDLEVLGAQRRRDAVVAIALAGGRVFLAVSLKEVDLALLAGEHLDEAVGQLLLIGGNDALGSSLVVEHHGAIGLHLILVRLARAACLDRCSRPRRSWTRIGIRSADHETDRTHSACRTPAP